MGLNNVISNQTTTVSEWDASAALANVDGELSDLKELLEIWLTQEPVQLSTIQNALKTSNSIEIHRAAHTLKGSLKLFGFESAVEKAERLEIAGKTKQIADGTDLYQQLEEELKVVNQQVSNFLASH